MSESASGWAIRLDEIGKRFDGRWVLRNVSLTVPSRGIVAVTGPSGSGKTTLARLAVKLDLPTEGVVRHHPGLTRSVLFAEDRLLPELSIRRNLAYVGLTAEEYEPLADRLGLAGQLDAVPAELSSGMNRRVAFMRAIGHPAGVVLLDEPFKGLDDPLRDRLAEEIRRRSHESAVILIDHDTSLVGDLADRHLSLR